MQQQSYMNEIYDTYRNAKHKKEKEQFLVNLKSVMDILNNNIKQSTETL